MDLKELKLTNFFKPLMMSSIIVGEKESSTFIKKLNKWTLDQSPK